MKKTYYLAYGSNLNEKQMKRRCPDATKVGTSFIDGYRLMFKGSKTGAYLTIEKAKGHKVPVGVWLVSGQDLASLDVYEGYPSFYYRKWVNVPFENKNATQGKINALVYIMHEDRKLACPTKFYVDTYLEGYEDFGFDKRFLLEALKFSLEANDEDKR